MRRTGSLLLLALLAFLGAGSVTTPAAGAPTSGEKTVGVAEQAWYLDNEASPCAALTCPEGLPTSASPFPPGTLHVGVEGGRPNAHAYLRPQLARVPPGSRVVGGVVHLPVSADPQAVTVAPEQARITACPVTEAFPDGVEGGLTPAPAFDCAKLAVPAKFVAAESTFTVALDQFLTLWESGLPELGIALLAFEPAPQESWQVSFSGKGAEVTPRIRATLVYEPDDGGAPRTPAQQPDTTPSRPGPSVDPAPAPGQPAPPISSGGVSSDVPLSVPPAESEPLVAAPVIDAPAVAGTATAGQPVTLVRGYWYRYAGVPFLPIIIALGMRAIGTSLTRPLTPRSG